VKLETARSANRRRSLTAPLVSVVTPLYNSSAYIDATLQSLQAQTFTNWESILVDDGSTDNTRSQVARFLEDERFSYVQQPNQGIAVTRNAGIRLAKGAWIALLDHDDRWLPEKLERQLDAAARSGWDIVCTNASVVRDGGQTLYSDYLPAEMRSGLEHRAGAPGDVFGLLIRMNFLCASSVLARHSLFDEHGLLDPAAAPADDYDMWLRCMPGAAVGYLPEPLVEYVLHESNYSYDSVVMRGAAIRVLFRTLARCAGDPVRVAQCEHSLTIHYAVLFQELLRARDYGSAFRHACRLGGAGARGLRILRRSWRIRDEVRAGF
jgi:glycosyltransferase involved in cell wall biosynthesis